MSEFPDKVLLWPDNRWCLFGTAIHLGDNPSPKKFVNDDIVEKLVEVLELAWGNCDPWLMNDEDVEKIELAIKQYKGEE